MSPEGVAARPLRLAAAVVGLEAAAAFASGVGFLVAVFSGKPADRPTAVTLAVLLMVVGVGLGLVARGLLLARPAAQTPAYLAQFFTLVISYYQRHTLLPVAIVLAAAAVVCVAGLAAPSSREALRRK